MVLPHSKQREWNQKPRNLLALTDYKWQARSKPSVPKLCELHQNEIVYSRNNFHQRRYTKHTIAATPPIPKADGTQLSGVWLQSDHKSVTRKRTFDVRRKMKVLSFFIGQFTLGAESAKTIAFATPLNLQTEFEII